MNFANQNKRKRKRKKKVKIGKFGIWILVQTASDPDTNQYLSTSKRNSDKNLVPGKKCLLNPKSHDESKPSQVSMPRNKYLSKYLGQRLLCQKRPHNEHDSQKFAT